MNEGPGNSSSDAKKNAPAKADEPAGSRGALLAAHARALDSRLRVAAQHDRQATRRAAAHVVQLARRIARLLPRVPTLLPVLPEGGRDARVRHYVLQTQPALGTTSTRILTISTHSVLRYGQFDGSGKPVLWNEYDPLQPVVGWELETVLERLADVLAQITEQVELLEARIAERATTLNALLHSTAVGNQRPLAGPPVSAPLRTGAVSSGATPLSARPLAAPPRQEAVKAPSSAAPPAPSADVPDALNELPPELALIDLAFGEPPAEYDVAVPSEADEHAEGLDDVFPLFAIDEGMTPPLPAAPPVDAIENSPDPGTADAPGEGQKRERRLFQHLRVR